MRSIEKYFPLIIVGAALFLFKPLFRLINSVGALVPDVNTIQEDNFQNTIVAIDKSAAVKTQMNVLNQSRADQLYKAMDKIGTNKDTILSILLAKDMGPNQFGAIYKFYGIRELHAFGFPVLKGDLLVHLRDEMGSDYATKLEPTINSFLKQIK